jgi:hypothetical protein
MEQEAVEAVSAGSLSLSHVQEEQLSAEGL